MDAIDIANFDAFQRQKQTNIKIGLVMVSIVFVLACLYFLYRYFEPKTSKEPKTVEQFIQANDIPYIPATLQNGQVFLNNTPQQANGYVNPPQPGQEGYIGNIQYPNQ